MFPNEEYMKTAFNGISEELKRRPVAYEKYDTHTVSAEWKDQSESDIIATPFLYVLNGEFRFCMCLVTEDLTKFEEAVKDNVIILNGNSYYNTLVAGKDWTAIDGGYTIGVDYKKDGNILPGAIAILKANTVYGGITYPKCGIYVTGSLPKGSSPTVRSKGFSSISWAYKTPRYVQIPQKLLDTDQADWQENDPTAPSYVKNRIGGYPIITEKSTNIEWQDRLDKNAYTYPLYVSFTSSTETQYKMSLFTENITGIKDAIANDTVSVVAKDWYTDCISGKKWEQINGGYVLGKFYSNNNYTLPGIIVIFKENTKYGGFTYYRPGIYVSCPINNYKWLYNTYMPVTSMSWTYKVPDHSKIPQKFIEQKENDWDNVTNRPGMYSYTATKTKTIDFSQADGVETDAMKYAGASYKMVRISDDYDGFVNAITEEAIDYEFASNVDSYDGQSFAADHWGFLSSGSSGGISWKAFGRYYDAINTSNMKMAAAIGVSQNNAIVGKVTYPKKGVYILVKTVNNVDSPYVIQSLSWPYEERIDVPVPDEYLPETVIPIYNDAGYYIYKKDIVSFNETRNYAFFDSSLPAFLSFATGKIISPILTDNDGTHYIIKYSIAAEYANTLGLSRTKEIIDGKSSGGDNAFTLHTGNADPGVTFMSEKLSDAYAAYISGKQILIKDSSWHCVYCSETKIVFVKEEYDSSNKVYKHILRIGTASSDGKIQFKDSDEVSGAYISPDTLSNSSIVSGDYQAVYCNQDTHKLYTEKPEKMKGATTIPVAADGEAGLVPAPTKNDSNKFLRGDGTWADVESSSDLSLGVTNATPGQIAKISAVDENGKPTAWEPADLPSGGGGDWVFAGSVTAESAGMALKVSNIHAKHILVSLYASCDDTSSRGYNIVFNDVLHAQHANSLSGNSVKHLWAVEFDLLAAGDENYIYSRVWPNETHHTNTSNDPQTIMNTTTLSGTMWYKVGISEFNSVAFACMNGTASAGNIMNVWYR